ncbi:tetratricopeptide repeat protein [Thermogutta sp.]|jgi:Flp pilus assembly protein TadD|uniref:tetratricopeptide repeat protein n=1 Tax=Thermogutta sp. TaxID=1962930 RepID=UPI00321FD61C
MMVSVDEMYDQAIELQQKGDLDGAIQKLHELLETDPNYALAHAALSVFYSKREEHEKAVEHARKVCELEPEDPFSFVALSLICQKAGLIAEAEEAMWHARQAQVAAIQRRHAQ